MSPCGVVNCKVLGPQGPLLTNRMSAITHVRVCGGRRAQARPLPGTERGRAASVSNSDATGRPRRSVLPFAW